MKRLAMSIITMMLIFLGASLQAQDLLPADSVTKIDSISNVIVLEFAKQVDTTATVKARRGLVVAPQPITVLSVFAGNYISAHNSYNKGHWYGLYYEHTPISISGLNIGVSVVASQGGYNNQDTINKYSEDQASLGFGIATGYYVKDLSEKWSGFFNTNTIWKRGLNTGEGLNVLKPEANQEKWLLNEYTKSYKQQLLELTANASVFKKYFQEEKSMEWWPQFRLTALYQIPLGGMERISWNTEVAPLGELANNHYLEFRTRAAILQYQFAKVNIEPRIDASYATMWGGYQTSWANYGLEFVIKKNTKNLEFLILSFLVKNELNTNNLNSRLFVFNISLLPLSW